MAIQLWKSSLFWASLLTQHPELCIVIHKKKAVCLFGLLGATLHALCNISTEAEGTLHSWRFSCFKHAPLPAVGPLAVFSPAVSMHYTCVPCHSGGMMNRLSNSYLLKRKTSRIPVAIRSSIKEKHWELTFFVYHHSIDSSWMALLLNHLIMPSCR